MTTQSPTRDGSKSTLSNLLAVALVVWLLFFGGFSTLKAWLTPAKLSQAGQIADTIRTGVGRVTTGSSAPAAKLPAAAPAAQPRVNSGAQPTAATQAQIEAAADAAYQATAVAMPAAAPASRSAGGLPTAAVVVPTVAPVEQITVVPRGVPNFASNQPPTVTPIPTLVYPSPLPAAAAAYELTPDGKCVIAPRAGKRYQVCQDWKYQPNEAASVADYIRTGLLPGVEVQ